MLPVQRNAWLTLNWQLWEAALDGICIGIESVKAALACCVVAALHCVIDNVILAGEGEVTANPSCQLRKEKEEEANQN
jgi:hypothetical protein